MDLIVDLEDLGRYTHIGFKNASEAIAKGVEMIITPHILLVNSAISNGYSVHITNGEKNVDINKLVLNEDKMPHDLIIDELINHEINVDISTVLKMDHLNPRYFDNRIKDFYNTTSEMVDKLSLLISHYYLPNDNIMNENVYKDDPFISSIEKLCLHDRENLRFSFALSNNELSIFISHMSNITNNILVPKSIITMIPNDIKLYAKELYKNNITLRKKELEIKNKAIYKKEYKEYLKLKEKFEGDNYE